MKQVLFLSLLIASVLLMGPACSKKNDVNSNINNITASKCNLVTIAGVSGNTTTTFRVSYNNDGEISVLKTEGANASTKVFNYSGSTIRAITTNEAGVVIKRDSIQLNSNGLMSFSQSIDVTTNRKTINSFTYGGNGQLQKSTSQTEGGTVFTTNYTFANGDLASSDGTTPVTYTYYTDRRLADGDYLQLIQLVRTGGFIIKNSHLVKSILTGPTLQNFIYDFDADGKIIKLTGTTGSTIEALNYQYECR